MEQATDRPEINFVNLTAGGASLSNNLGGTLVLNGTLSDDDGVDKDKICIATALDEDGSGDLSGVEAWSAYAPVSGKPGSSGKTVSFSHNLSGLAKEKYYLVRVRVGDTTYAGTIGTEGDFAPTNRAQSDIERFVLDTKAPTIAIAQAQDRYLGAGFTLDGTVSDEFGIAGAGNGILLIDLDGDGTLEAGETAALGAGGAWSATIATPFTTGSHIITMGATDRSGLAANANFAYRVDVTPPAMGADLQPAQDSWNQGTFVISGTASDDDSGVNLVEIAIDRNNNGSVGDAGVDLAWTAVAGTTSWSYTYNSGSGIGTQVIHVRATDKVGLAGAEALRTIRLDQASPNLAIGSPLANTFQTGTTTVSGSASDDYGLAIHDFDYYGLHDARPFVEIRHDGNLAGSAVTVSGGVVSLAGHALANGDAVYFSATAMPANLTADKAYFVRDAVAGVSFKLAATQGGAELVPAPEGGTAVVCQAWKRLPVDGSGNWTMSLPSADIGQGLAKKIYLRTVDQAGKSSLAEVSVKVDTIAPTASFTAPANGSWQKGAVAISGTVLSGDTSGIAKAQLAIIPSGDILDPSADYFDISVKGDLSWTYTYDSSLVNADRDIYIRAVDNAGNTAASYSAMRAIRLDQVAPTLAALGYGKGSPVAVSSGTFTSYSHGFAEETPVVFSAASGGSMPSSLTAGTTYYVINATADSFQLSATTPGGTPLASAPSGGASVFVRRAAASPYTAGGTVYANAPFTLSGSAADTGNAASVVASVTIEESFNSGGYAAVAPSPGGTTAWSWTKTNADTASEGSYSYRITAFDSAGNSSLVSYFTVLLDRTAPSSPTITSPASDGERLTGGTVTAQAAAADPAGSGLDTVEMRFAADAAWSRSESNGSAWVAALSHGAEGSKTLQARCKDRAGNVSGAASRTYWRDDAPPTASFNSPAANWYTNRNLVVSMEGLDTHGVKSIGVTLSDSAKPVPHSVSGSLALLGLPGDTSLDGTWDNASSPLAVASLADGACTITATVTDLSDRVVVYTREINLDTAKPTVAYIAPAASSTTNKTIAVNGTSADNVVVRSLSLFAVKAGAGFAVAIDPATDLISATGHGLAAGDVVAFSGTALPSGIAADSFYYVISDGLGADAFAVAASAGGASRLDFVDSGSGLSAAPAGRAIATTGSYGWSATGQLDTISNPAVLHARSLVAGTTYSLTIRAVAVDSAGNSSYDPAHPELSDRTFLIDQNSDRPVVRLSNVDPTGLPSPTTLKMVTSVYGTVTDDDGIASFAVGEASFDGVPATAAASTDRISAVGHGLAAGTPLYFSGTTPGGLTPGARYYVIAADLAANYFKVAATPTASTGIDLTTDVSSGMAITAFAAVTVTGGSWSYQSSYGDGTKTIYFKMSDSAGASFATGSASSLDKPYVYSTPSYLEGAVSYKVDTKAPEWAAEQPIRVDASSPFDFVSGSSDIVTNMAFGGPTSSFAVMVRAFDANGIKTVRVDVPDTPGTPYPAAAVDANAVGSTNAASTLRTGARYRIVAPGTTDFVGLGAATNVAGTEFYASRDGVAGDDSGGGTAMLLVNAYRTAAIDASGAPGGSATITIEVTDNSDLVSTSTRTVIFDNKAPSLTYQSPRALLDVVNGDVTVKGLADDSDGAASISGVKSVAYKIGYNHATQSWTPTGGSLFSWQIDFTGLNRVDLYAGRALALDHATDRFALAAHGYQDGDRVWFDGSVLPAGLSTATDYYVANRTADSFQISASPSGSPVLLFGDNGSDLAVSKYSRDQNNDGIWELPLLVRAEDNAGNATNPGDATYVILVDPSGDKPKVEVVYPEPAALNRVMGGIIRVMGTASDDDAVDSVWMQIDVNNDGVYDASDAAGGVNWYYTENGANGVYDPGVDDLGRKVSGTVSWNKSINASGEFNPADNLSGTATPSANSLVAAALAGNRNINLVGAKITLGGTVERTIGSWNPATGEIGWDVAQTAYSASTSYLVENFTSSIQFRVRARDISAPAVFGAWSSSQRIDIDNKVPKIGSTTAIHLYQGATHLPYTADMWVKGDWTLGGSIEDESGITAIEITGDITGSLAANSGWFSPAGGGNYDLQLPIDTVADGWGNINLKIKVYDGSTPQMSSEATYSINFDNKNPTINAYTGSLPIVQSNKLYTLKSSVTEQGAGFDRVAFYFLRQGATDPFDRLYNPMEAKTGDANRTYLGALAMVDGLPRLQLTGATRVAGDPADDEYKLSHASLVNNRNVRPGGLVKIGGIDRKIISVDYPSGTIGWAEPVPTSFTAADVAYALVVDNQSQYLEAAVWSGDVLAGITNDDGDGMIESIDRVGSDFDWTAAINSKNIPDGPVEIHYVAYDKAGNWAAGSAATSVQNNRPLLASAILGTDLDRDGSVTAEEKSLPYSALDGNGKEQAEAVIASSAFKARGLTTIEATVVGGNGALQYAFDLGAQAAVGAGTFSAANHGLADGDQVLFYAASMPANLAVATAYYVRERTDNTFKVEASPGGGALAPAPDGGTVTILKVIRPDELSAAGPMKVTEGALLSIGDGARTFAFTIWDSTEETVPGQATGQKCVLSVPLSVNVRDASAPSAAITPLYWNDASTNSLYGASLANGHIEIKAAADEEVSGSIKIEGTSSDDQLISALWMHIDGFAFPHTASIPRKTYGAGTSVTGIAANAFDRAAHGLADGDAIIFRTTAPITGITDGVVYYVVNALADSFQVAETVGGAAVPCSGGAGISFHDPYYRVAYFDPAGSAPANHTKLANGFIVPADEFGTRGWSFTVTGSSIGQAGHSVAWQLNWNSATVSYGAMLDRGIAIRIEDRGTPGSGLSSGTAIVDAALSGMSFSYGAAVRVGPVWTYATAFDDVSDTLTLKDAVATGQVAYWISNTGAEQSMQVDVVPYIRDIAPSKPFTKRLTAAGKLGYYPLFRTAAGVAITGFNLPYTGQASPNVIAGNGAIDVGGNAIAGASVTGAAAGRTSVTVTIPATLTSGALVVATNGIASTNQNNANANPYNQETVGATAVTDDRYLYLDDAPPTITVAPFGKYYPDSPADAGKSASSLSEYNDNLVMSGSDRQGHVEYSQDSGFDEIAVNGIDTGTEVITTAASHGLRVGQMVFFGKTADAGAALPAGIDAATPYYVRLTPSASTFTVSAAQGGAVFNFTDQGSYVRLRDADVSGQIVLRGKAYDNQRIKSIKATIPYFNGGAGAGAAFTVYDSSTDMGTGVLSGTFYDLYSSRDWRFELESEGGAATEYKLDSDDRADRGHVFNWKLTLNANALTRGAQANVQVLFEVNDYYNDSGVALNPSGTAADRGSASTSFTAAALVNNNDIAAGTLFSLAGQYRYVTGFDKATGTVNWSGQDTIAAGAAQAYTVFTHSGVAALSLDVVPYITGIANEANKGLANAVLRSASGKYSVDEYSAGANPNSGSLQLAGFNLGNASYQAQANVSPSAITAYNAGLPAPAVTGTTGTALTVAKTAAKSGYLTVFVNDVPSVNNLNGNASAHGSDKYNAEVDTAKPQSGQWTDDRYLWTWVGTKVNPTVTTQTFYYPNMVMSDASTPMFAYCNNNDGYMYRTLGTAASGTKLMGRWFARNATLAKNEDATPTYFVLTNEDNFTGNDAGFLYMQMADNTGAAAISNNGTYPSPAGAIELMGVEVGSRQLNRFKYPSLIATGTGNTTQFYASFFDAHPTYANRGIRFFSFRRNGDTTTNLTESGNDNAIAGNGNMLVPNTNADNSSAYTAMTLVSKNETLSAVNAGTETITVSGEHNLEVNDIVYFTTTGTMPGGLNANVTYFVIARDKVAGTFQVSTTRGGGAANITGTTWSGTVTAVCADIAIAYYDPAAMCLKMAYSGSHTLATGLANTSADWTTIPDVDTSELAGSNVSMVNDGTYLYLAYADAGNADLKFIRMDWRNKTKTTVVVDSYLSVGVWTNIQLIDGLPYVSYYNNSYNGTRSSIKIAFPVAANGRTAAQNMLQPGAVAATEAFTGNWEAASVPALTIPMGGMEEFTRTMIGAYADTQNLPLVAWLGTPRIEYARLRPNN